MVMLPATRLFGLVYLAVVSEADDLSADNFTYRNTAQVEPTCLEFRGKIGLQDSVVLNLGHNPSLAFGQREDLLLP